MGKAPETIPEYMNYIAGYTLREVGEPPIEYKQRLFRLAVEAYRRDYGDAPPSPEWGILRPRPRKQMSIAEGLKHDKQKKLLAAKEKYCR